MVNRDVPAVKREPSERSKLATFPPLVLLKVRVEVEACCKSKVVEPWVKGIFASLIVRSLKVLAPVKVWVLPKSATVILPVGKVALVVTPPVVRVNAADPATAKFCANESVPVVHAGVLDPADTNACPAEPTVVKA